MIHHPGAQPYGYVPTLVTRGVDQFCLAGMVWFWKALKVMSVLFNHAWRYELFDRNSIKLVRQSAKRRAAPNVLIPAEIKLLLDNLSLRERTLVLLAASTGLRQSEIFALKWGDIDFTQGTINVMRSIVYGVVGRCKTESSQKPVPVHPIFAEALVK